MKFRCYTYKDDIPGIINPVYIFENEKNKVSLTRDKNNNLVWNICTNPSNKIIRLYIGENSNYFLLDALDQLFDMLIDEQNDRIKDFQELTGIIVKDKDTFSEYQKYNPYDLLNYNKIFAYYDIKEIPSVYTSVKLSNKFMIIKNNYGYEIRITNLAHQDSFDITFINDEKNESLNIFNYFYDELAESYQKNSKISQK